MSWQDDVASAWNALRNEAHGRGAAPRELPTEAQRNAQAEVLERFIAFRDFANDPVASAFDTRWNMWRSDYFVTRAQWAGAMGGSAAPLLQAGSFLSDTAQQASSEYAAIAQQLGLQRKIATGLALLGAFGLAAFALTRGRKRG